MRSKVRDDFSVKTKLAIEETSFVSQNLKFGPWTGPARMQLSVHDIVRHLISRRLLLNTLYHLDDVDDHTELVDGFRLRKILISHRSCLKVFVRFGKELTQDKHSRMNEANDSN